MPWLGGGLVWVGMGYNLALLALVVTDYSRLKASRDCTARRVCGDVFSLGEQNPVWIEIDNRSSEPFHVVARDEPPLEFSVTKSLLTLEVGPREKARDDYKVLPHARGDYRFGDLNVRYTTKLGFVMRQERIPAELGAKVYPDILQTKKHLLLARENRIVQMGLRRSRIYGQGQEFERLRDYVPDDSPRHIDWKATARRRVLTTREYDIEQSQQIMILLDIGRSMASHTIEPDGSAGITKADCAINAAVLLAHVAAQSDDRVGLFCFAAAPVTYVPPGKGNPQASRLMEALYPLQPRIEEPAYHDNFLFLTQKQKKRSLIFLMTDLIDPIASKSLISSIGLLTRTHLVVCVALADYELPEIIHGEATKGIDLYAKTVASSILRDRKKALGQLMNQGVIAMDATPSDLSVTTVNKYLQLKREGRL
jgi:uncharacterized protein (DUF58 family)